MRVKSVLLAAVGLTAAALPSWPDKDGADRDEVARRIRERVAELENVREERQDATRSFRDRRQRMQSTLDALEGERRRLAAEETTLRAEVETLQGEASSSADTAAGTAFLTEFAAMATPIVQRLRERVASGIPFQRDLRRGRIAEVEARLGRPDALDARTLSELWAWASEELRLSAGIEFFNEPVILDGGSRLEHAYHLRLGTAHQFAISEDTAWIARAEGEGWVELEDDDERAALILALRVLQRQEPPTVVPLPVPSGGR